MIAVAGDSLIAFRRRHYDAGDDRFLTNEMAKPPMRPMPYICPFFLEPTDEEHVAKGGQFLFLVESGAVRARDWCFPRCGFAAVGELQRPEDPFATPRARATEVVQLRQERSPRRLGQQRTARKKLKDPVNIRGAWIIA